MQITIIAVGKIKESYLRAGISEYLKRMPPFAKVNMIEVADEKTPDGASTALAKKIKDKEGEKILAALPHDSWVCVLDLGGQNLSSTQLAATISQLNLNGTSHLTFIIGGSLGLSTAVLQQADFSLSFGAMTFPHQLMRLILTEQLYRAMKINKNEPYHK